MKVVGEDLGQRTRREKAGEGKDRQEGAWEGGQGTN